MALPVGRAIRNSRTVVVAGDLAGLPLLMPRYSLSYDMGLGLGVDAFAPSLSRSNGMRAVEQGMGRRPAGPGSTMLGGYASEELGDASSDIARYQRAVLDMDKAIALAKAKQPAAVAGLVAQRDRLRALIEALKPKAYQADMPSPIATGVASIGDFVRGLGGNVALAAGIGVAALVLLPMLTRGSRG